MIENIDSFSTFVQLMVDGLKKRWVNVDMGTYGDVRYNENSELVCFGCAATNALCELNQQSFDVDRIRNRTARAEDSGLPYEDDDYTIAHLEGAWDNLRSGNVRATLEQLKYIRGLSFAVPDMGDLQGTSYCVPQLGNTYTPQDLMAYEAWAGQLKEKGL